MQNLKHGLEDTAAEIADQLGKIRTPKSRASDTIERVFSLLEGDIDPAVIALQMKCNTGTDFGEQDMHSYHKLYTVSKSQVAITKKQTVSLLRDQQNSDAPLPAVQGA